MRFGYCLTGNQNALEGGGEQPRLYDAIIADRLELQVRRSFSTNYGTRGETRLRVGLGEGFLRFSAQVAPFGGIPATDTLYAGGSPTFWEDVDRQNSTFTIMDRISIPTSCMASYMRPNLQDLEVQGQDGDDWRHVLSMAIHALPATPLGSTAWEDLAQGISKPDHVRVSMSTNTATQSVPCMDRTRWVIGPARRTITATMRLNFLALKSNLPLLVNYDSKFGPGVDLMLGTMWLRGGQFQQEFDMPPALFRYDRCLHTETRLTIERDEENKIIGNLTLVYEQINAGIQNE